MNIFEALTRIKRDGGFAVMRAGLAVDGSVLRACTVYVRRPDGHPYGPLPPFRWLFVQGFGKAIVSEEIDLYDDGAFAELDIMRGVLCPLFSVDIDACVSDDWQIVPSVR